MEFRTRYLNTRIGKGTDAIEFNKGSYKTDEQDKIDLLKKMGFVPVGEKKATEDKATEDKATEDKATEDKEEDKEEDKTYKCNHCDFETKSIGALKGHMTKNPSHRK